MAKWFRCDDDGCDPSTTKTSKGWMVGCGTCGWATGSCPDRLAARNVWSATLEARFAESERLDREARHRFPAARRQGQPAREGEG